MVQMMAIKYILTDYLPIGKESVKDALNDSTGYYTAIDLGFGTILSRAYGPAEPKLLLAPHPGHRPIGGPQGHDRSHEATSQSPAAGVVIMVPGAVR
jgi:hypothetical protein